MLSGKAREVNARFAAMVSHYLFEAEFCSPASGWEKGQIEKNVQDARHRIWQTATTRCAGCAMQPDPRVTTLKQLKLFGMAQAIEELASQGGACFPRGAANSG